MHDALNAVVFLVLLLSYVFYWSRFASHTNGTGLCQSPQLKVGDFSYNFFVGKVPPCLMYLPR